ncbi:MAG: trypsin-like serine protease [Bdellovibrionales bacterium]|nr:trypsin-like serine protease [Bdellovibrionales bacterium]
MGTSFRLVCLGAITLTACVGEPQAEICRPTDLAPPAHAASVDAESGVGVITQALANGETDPDQRFEAVMCVGGVPQADGTNSPCGSATLVAPDYILTALHLGGLGPNGTLPLHFGPEARDIPLHAATAVECWEFRDSGPARCCRHPGPDATAEQLTHYLDTCEEPLAENDFVISDLALWRLDRDVTAEYQVAPIPVATGNVRDLNGQIAIAVGYGSTDSCFTPQTRSGVRRWGAVRVRGTTTEGTLTGGGEAVYPSDVYIDAEFAQDWPFTAPGDSGGPILVDSRADERGDGECIPVSDLRVAGATYRGCNYSWSSALHPKVAPAIQQLLNR